MSKPTKSTIVQLVVACFVVGIALSVFQITPAEVVTNAASLGKELVKFSVATLGTFFSYVLLGAILVVPIWLFFYLWGGAGGNESD